MAGRTVILVSHHVQLCAPGAAFVISLDNGAVTYSGSSKEFLTNGVDPDLLKDDPEDHSDEGVEIIEDVEPTDAEEEKVTAAVPAIAEKRAAPRKLIEDEQRATGRISRDVWLLYLRGCVSLPLSVPRLLLTPFLVPC
jgi:ABC-type multidrug transport system ATPase subunit